MKKLTDEQRALIVDRVAHEGAGVGWAMGEFDLDIEEIEEIMLDANYERCPECENFVECGELADAEGDERPCFNCKPLAGDDEE